MAYSSHSKRASLRAAAAVLVLLICVAIGAGGFFAGRRYEQVSLGIPSSAVANSATPQGIKGDFSLFWKSWNLIDSKFYGEKDDKKRVDGAIAGMVASLGDPYTTYLAPSANSMFQSDLQGTFGGIGAELNVKDGNLTVVSSLDGTPAQKQGLKGGDIIIEIDGTKVQGMAFNDAINKIRGAKGSSVTLTIARSGEEAPLKITLVRDTIVVKSVKTDTIGTDKNIAYIKVNEFGQDTADSLRTALENAAKAGRKGVVLDLRDNPGGYLQAAVRAIGMVIPSTVNSDKERLNQRTAVLERSRDGKETADKSTESPVYDTGKLVVLVNGGSASAAEIFAGAMKDYGRAQLVGVKTFGKGSVQELNDLSNGGSVKVTVAKWFTPLGTGIDRTGITPDVIVELPKDSEQGIGDVQVAKALELLK